MQVFSLISSEKKSVYCYVGTYSILFFNLTNLANSYKCRRKYTISGLCGKAKVLYNFLYKVIPISVNSPSPLSIHIASSSYTVLYRVQYISLLKAFIHHSSTQYKRSIIKYCNISYTWMFLSVPLYRCI